MESIHENYENHMLDLIADENADIEERQQMQQQQLLQQNYRIHWLIPSWLFLLFGRFFWLAKVETIDKIQSSSCPNAW